MTIKQWLNQAANTLADLGITSSRIDSELILGHVLGKDKSYLIAHDTDVLEETHIQAAEALLARRITNEPMAFILGQKEFFGLPFKTDTRALIPRWETEVLVETALDFLSSSARSDSTRTWGSPSRNVTLPSEDDEALSDSKTQEPLSQAEDDKKTVLEVGTGCGAIGVTLAHSAPQHTYLATELSEEALALAKENAHLAKPGEIHFALGDFATPFLESYAGKIDLLVANLPYIPRPLLINLDTTVTYFEPNIALDGGEDGLELYRQFMPQAQKLLAPGGLLLCEHDFDQGEAMRTIVQASFPNAEIKTLQDSLSHDRLLWCKI